MNLNDPDFQKQLHRWSPTSSRWLDPDMDPMDARIAQQLQDLRPLEHETGIPILPHLYPGLTDTQFLRQLGIAPLGVE